MAAGILFLPDLLDGKKEQYREEFASVPLKPEAELPRERLPFEKSENLDMDSELLEEPVQTVETSETLPDEPAQPVTLPAKKAPVDLAPVDVAAVKPSQPPKAEPAKPKEATPKPKPKAVVVKATPQPRFKGSAWTVQLGVFRNAANVQELVKKLRKAGYQVHTSPAKITQGELNKVFIGPDVSKQKLEKKLAALKKLTGLQGRLIAFDPIKIR